MDLSDTLSAEMLSDEVLAEITEQLELTSGQNAREELFERIAEKYNMKKEIVLKHHHDGCTSTMHFLTYLAAGADCN